MLHLRRCILTRLVSSPSASRISPLHRFISVAAPAVSTNPGFATEEYLVETCGLTRAQALKASTKLSHLKSPTKPDAVIAFLAGLGLSGADVAAVVAKDPLFLCSGVDRTLEPNFVGLTALGLSRSEIARLASLAPICLRCKSTVSNLPYYMSLFGSSEGLLRALKRSHYFLTTDLAKVVKPNVKLLRDCGLSACHIAKLSVKLPRILTTNPERIRAMVACTEGLGVPRLSPMFRLALHAVAFNSEEKIAAKLEYLKRTFSWSDSEAGIAVCKAPTVLSRSKESLRRTSEFLISEVGLEPAYIADRPVMIGYSLEARIRPRYYVLKFLKEEGVLRKDRDYYSTLMISDKIFMEKLICPHTEAAPHLAEDYAAACRGELPTRFKLT